MPLRNSKNDFWRSVGKAEKVYTGHSAGRITINIREADDVERGKLRVDLGEAQRTLIGHFRHEIGHFYWDVLVKGRREDQCKAVFGDHTDPPYADALNSFYQNGPPTDWAQAHYLPRRFQPALPGELQREAQRGQRRGQPRRSE